MKILRILSIAVFALGLNAGALAGGDQHTDEQAGRTAKKSKAMKDLSPEQRQEMADAHSSMAECLRSDRAIQECRTDMKKKMKSSKEQAGQAAEEPSMMPEDDQSGIQGTEPMEDPAIEVPTEDQTPLSTENP